MMLKTVTSLISQYTHAAAPGAPSMAQGRLCVPLDCSPHPPEKPPMEAECICCSIHHGIVTTPSACRQLCSWRRGSGRGAEAKVLIEYPDKSLEMGPTSH